MACCLYCHNSTRYSRQLAIEGRKILNTKRLRHEKREIGILFTYFSSLLIMDISMYIDITTSRCEYSDRCSWIYSTSSTDSINRRPAEGVSCALCPSPLSLEGRGCEETFDIYRSLSIRVFRSGSGCSSTHVSSTGGAHVSMLFHFEP